MMVKAFKYFFLTLLVVMPITWLSNYPGEVRIIWKDYFIETNVLGILFIFISGTVTVLLIYIFYNKILSIPKRYKLFKKERDFSQGNKALTKLTESLVLGKKNEVEINARKIKKYLNNTIFSGYILSQNAIMEGDFIKAKKYLNILLKSPEGEFIGLKGLALISLKQKKDDDARSFLEKAKKIQPNNSWVADNLSLLFASQEMWEDAANVLKEIKNDLRIKDNRASFLIQSGSSPIDAWKISNNFIPVALKAINYYLDKEDEKNAFEIIRKSWKSLLYVKMIELFMNKNNNSQKISLRRFKLVLKALKPSLANDETKLGMAMASFKASLWGETKKYLDLIDRENWDSRVVDLWKSLSLETKRIEIPDIPETVLSKPMWRCKSCLKQSDDWQIKCNNCGKIGTTFWPKSIKVYEIENSVYL